MASSAQQSYENIVELGEEVSPRMLRSRERADDPHVVTVRTRSLVLGALLVGLMAGLVASSTTFFAMRNGTLSAVHSAPSADEYIQKSSDIYGDVTKKFTGGGLFSNKEMKAASICGPFNSKGAETVFCKSVGSLDQKFASLSPETKDIVNALDSLALIVRKMQKKQLHHGI